MQIETKKIIFVVHSLRGGGAEKVASTLIESLQGPENNLELTLVLFGPEQLKIPKININVKYLNVRESGNIACTIKKFFTVIYRLSKIFKRESPSVILSFMDYSNVVCIIANLLSGKKHRVVISVHAPPTAQMDKYAANYWDKIMGMLIKRIYNSALSIIAVSRHTRDDLVENYGINKNLIHIIHNPIDLDKINFLSSESISDELFNENVPIILSVGRLSKEKGIEFLLRAFSRIEQKTNARVVILGEGKENANLNKLSKELGINKKVYFLGFKDNPYKYMKRSSVFVLPSLYEGFGVVLIEAMACDIPIVATKSYEGIEEIVDHERTGLLVPVADEEALANAMLRLLKNPEERSEYSVHARRKAMEFSVEKISGEYKRVLMNVEKG